MKKIIYVVAMLLIFSTMLLVLLSSNSVPEIEEPENKEYKIIYYGRQIDLFDSIFNDSLPSNVVSVENAYVDEGIINDKFINEKAPKTKKISFNGETFDLTYEYSYSRTGTSLDNRDVYSCGIFPNSTYVYQFDFWESTGELIKYQARLVKEHAESKNFTEDQVKDAAEKLLASLYGEEKFGEYTFESINYVADTSLTGWKVKYTKYIQGYKTADVIYVVYNAAGEILRTDATYFGLFDKLEKEDIESADKVIRESVCDSWDLNDACLVLAEGGIYYLRNTISMDYVNDAKEISETKTQIYINVE
ncbi:MAG: hypothetical protein E7633_06345 [Ruminococcaceae bacterium]|nr:hypothetical protein [Oscillospiraceae bacterium]